MYFGTLTMTVTWYYFQWLSADADDPGKQPAERRSGATSRGPERGSGRRRGNRHSRRDRHRGDGYDRPAAKPGKPRSRDEYECKYEPVSCPGRHP